MTTTRITTLLLCLLAGRAAFGDGPPEPRSGLVQALGGEHASRPDRNPGPLRTDGPLLRDPHGRVVLLRGVNVGLKRAPFLPAHTNADVARLVDATGINLVRLSIAWRAVEPQPGRYDAAYLSAVADAAARWTRHGVYVLVDMHQDLWGGPITAHGAPEWATLSRGRRALELPAGAPWQARYLDPRVIHAFEALYANARVPATGRGLADHYAAAWAAVARRLAPNPRVIGYDLLNEPFYGAEVCAALRGLTWRLAPQAASAGVRALWRRARHGEDLTQAFSQRLVARLQDPDRYAALGRGLAKANRALHPRLSALYARVGRAIRRAHPAALLFVEPVGPVGAGAPGGLPPLGLAGVVYAPHLYDAFMDSGQRYDGDLTRVRRTLQQHQREAARLGVPLVLGEWGNLVPMARSAGGRVGVARFARDVRRLLDQAQVGAAYWEHTPGAEADPLVRLALLPPRPR